MNEKLPSGITRRTGPRGDAYLVRYFDLARRRRAATFKTLREAEIFRAERLKDLAEGLHGGEQTLHEWWATWVISRPVAESTAEKRHHLYTQHLHPTLGSKPLNQIRRSDVQELVETLSKKHARKRPGQLLAHSTIVSTVQLLHAALSAAQLEGLIRSNPAAGQVPRIGDTARVERRFVTWAEARALEDAIDPHWTLIVPFLMETGLRIGEMAALRVRDVNTKEGWVRVRQSAVELHGRRRGELMYKTPKTLAGRRVVYTLSPDLRSRLEEMIRLRGLKSEDLLFTGPQGGGLRPSTFRARVWRPAVKRANLADPQPTPHALRHSAISYWLMSGAMTIFEASKLAGHSTIKVTSDIYGHIIDPRAREVQESLWRHRQQVDD